MFQNNVLSLPSLLRCVESIQMHGVHNMREDITKNKGNVKPYIQVWDNKWSGSQWKNSW